MAARSASISAVRVAMRVYWFWTSSRKTLLAWWVGVVIL